MGGGWMGAGQSWGVGAGVCDAGGRTGASVSSVGMSRRQQ